MTSTSADCTFDTAASADPFVDPVPSSQASVDETPHGITRERLPVNSSHNAHDDDHPDVKALRLALTSFVSRHPRGGERFEGFELASKLSEKDWTAGYQRIKQFQQAFDQPGKSLTGGPLSRMVSTWQSLWSKARGDTDGRREVDRVQEALGKLKSVFEHYKQMMCFSTGSEDYNDGVWEQNHERITGANAALNTFDRQVEAAEGRM